MRRVELAADRRARVPFALIGVLLLVGSGTYVAALQPRQPVTEPAVDVVMERTVAETQTALRTAVRRAAHDAAASPVVARANTSSGRVLNASSPFTDSLRVRIYLAARRALARIRTRREDVTARASLPPTPNASALRRAKERVRIERAGQNGTMLRVRVENVTVTARRGTGRAGRERYSPTVVVESPVLVAHDRVAAFQRRLNRSDPLRPGLARELTWRLYAVTWTRGYAMYGGAPIQNVLGNRHVELFTNSALLHQQRATFGRADRTGRDALRRATTRVAITDILSGAAARSDWVTAVLQGGRREPGVGGAATTLETDAPGPEDTMQVGPNRTVHTAYLDLVQPGTGDGGESLLTTVLNDVYSARVRLSVETRRTGGEEPAPPTEPGWELVGERVTTEVTVTNASGGTVTVPDGWHVLARYAREVERTRHVVRTWRRGNETKTTRTTGTARYDVDIGVLGNHSTTTFAPRRGIATVHEPGAGPLADRNLAGITPIAVRELVRDRGGPDAVAERAVEGGPDTVSRTIAGDQHYRLRSWITRDLRRLRERLGEVTVSVPRGEVGTYETNPPAELAAWIRNNRSRLLGVPETYGSVAAKARIAARGAYLDRVLARLDRRAEQRRRREGAFGDAVGTGNGTGNLSEVRTSMEAAGTRTNRSGSGVAPGGVRMSVDGVPPYLTLAEVSHREAPGLAPGTSIHPMAARNINVFTVPYADATDTLLDGLFEDTASVRTAALTLRAADGGAAATNRSYADRRARLRAALNGSLDRLRARVRSSLRRLAVGNGTAERRDIVAAGLSRWNGTVGRSLAFSNGSASESIAAAAVEHDPTMSVSDRVALRSWLRVVVTSGLETDAVRVSADLVNRTDSAARRMVERSVTAAVSRGLEDGASAVRRRLPGPVSQVPAGMPVSMVPGNWYATMNVWLVDVRGAYRRFSVRVPRGGPDRAGGQLTYVRDGAAVRIDFDDDGHRELFGHADRVSFRVHAAVVVVVPSGGNGVGDRNGDMDERSAGWRGWRGNRTGVGSVRVRPESDSH